MERQQESSLLLPDMEVFNKIEFINTRGICNPTTYSFLSSLPQKRKKGISFSMFQLAERREY